MCTDKYNQDGLCTWFQELSGTANRSIKYSSSSSNLLCNRPTQIIGNPLRVHIRNDSAPSPFQTHVKNDDGLPINVQAGALLGVRCSIFISGISFKCVEADLWKFVKEKSGRVVEDCILLKNKRSGTSKGQAIVKFMSHMDAKQALSTLHQCSFMGRELHARIAKDTVVGKPVLPECVVSYI